jgi:hypothetical protein
LRKLLDEHEKKVGCERQNVVKYELKRQDKIDFWEKLVVLQKETETIWKRKPPDENIGCCVEMERIKKTSQIQSLAKIIRRKWKIHPRKRKMLKNWISKFNDRTTKTDVPSDN